MFHIKWWIFVTIKIPLFLMYNTFECHFKPNHKKQSDMVDPVSLVDTVNHQSLEDIVREIRMLLP